MTDARPRRKKGRLRRLRLTELSLVDRPANPAAVITLAKRANPPPAQGDAPADPATFERAVEVFRKGGASRTDAMRQAARRYPALLARYQSEGRAVASTEKARYGARTDTLAAQEFELLVSGIMAREGRSRLEALRAAARQRPDLVEAYRRG